MNMRLVLCLLVFASCAMSLTAQTDTLKGADEDESTPRRKANAEWFAGLTMASYTRDATTFEGSTVRATDNRVLAHFGYGGHIPLTNLGRLTTIWLVPSASLGVGISKSSSEFESSLDGMSLDLCVPIHFTVGYGALRRKSIAWGVEGGLGVNVARRFAQEAFTVVPSLMVDISYAPRAIYRLRLMTDLIAGSIGETGEYRTWGVSFVLGFGD